METIARVAQLKEHVCILDVIADLVLDNSGTIYEPWTHVKSGGRQHSSTTNLSVQIDDAMSLVTLVSRAI